MFPNFGMSGGGGVFPENAKYLTIFRGDMFTNFGMLWGGVFSQTPNTLQYLEGTCSQILGCWGEGVFFFANAKYPTLVLRS